jgi:hypothetical protein
MSTTNDVSLVMEMTFTVPNDVTASQVYGSVLSLPQHLVDELKEQHISITNAKIKYHLEAHQAITAQFPNPQPYLGD